MSYSEGLCASGGQVQTNDLSSLMLAAHELKAPLIVMRQLSLAAADPTCSDVERHRFLTQLSLVADRGLRLTSNLTRTVRLEDALLPTEPINAQQLCEMIVREMTPLYEQYGRTIVCETGRTRPLVLAHRELLGSVMYHFVDNALHYGDDTGPVRVQLRSHPSRHSLQIGVRDYGPALSLKDWRAARTAPRGLPTRPHASGLGLLIAEQFSRAMGGTIGLTRHRDGATFYIELPLSEQLSLL